MLTQSTSGNGAGIVNMQTTNSHMMNQAKKNNSAQMVQQIYQQPQTTKNVNGPSPLMNFGGNPNIDQLS